MITNHRKIMILVKIYSKFKWILNLHKKVRFKNKFHLIPTTCLKNLRVKPTHKIKKFQTLYKANKKGFLQF